jgi:hypothetical protein
MTRDLRSEDSALLILAGLLPANGVNQIFSRRGIPLRLSQVRSYFRAVFGLTESLVIPMPG